MNTYSQINPSHHYPRLEAVLQTISQERDELQDSNYSSKLTHQQIQAVRDAVLAGHDGEFRLKGGYYIDEHLASMAEKSITFGVVPALTAAVLLHDTSEDTDKDTYSLKNPTLRDRNLTVLRESLQRADFSSHDERLIVNVCGIVTKLSDEEVKRKYDFDFPKEQLSEMRFHSKIERALGKEEWEKDSFFGNKVGVSHRFGAQLCGLLDIDDNFDPDEAIDISKYDEEKVKRFYQNKPRNLRRALVYGMKLDSSIRKLSQRPDCIINLDKFDSFIQNHYIRKLEKGLQTTSLNDIKVGNEILRYWNL